MAGYKELYKEEKIRRQQAEETVKYMINSFRGRPSPVGYRETAEEYMKDLADEHEKIINGKSQGTTGSN